MNTRNTFVLIAPQGTGKTRNAEKLAVLMGCQRIVDYLDLCEDEFLSGTEPSTLVLTNRVPYELPKEAIAIHVQDAEGIESLIAWLESLRTSTQTDD